jgi:signal transduction histidine kinase/ligand-binding sensor domain-containing protein/DNA-binding NarL/FixJ family response regulator
MGSEDGLSQNTAFSILFDSKGFMWIGTYNGLNRYDGYEFKIYRSNSENSNNLTNNRVTELWEDQKGFIWMETYDGYYHFFNPETEVFTSLPEYEGSAVINGEMQFFLQYSENIIFVGSAISGLYYLKYNPLLKTYEVKNYSNLTLANISDPRVEFLHKDAGGNIWIGTKNGLNVIKQEISGKNDLIFEHKYPGITFTCVCETSSELWFGTSGSGILAYNKSSGKVRTISSDNGKILKSDNLTSLYLAKNKKIIAGFENEGVMVCDSTGTDWKPVQFHSKTLSSVFEDREGNAWLTAIEFGATKLDLKDLSSKYYVLTPEEIRPLTDLERPQFFEDTKGNLWLGLHGSGLALYNKAFDRFDFFRNNTKDANSISSNFIHCIAEDRSGQLWIGTGQVIGGIEKAILKNSAFEHFLPERNGSDILDNVARAVLEDKNKNLWVATKSGRLHLFDSTLHQVKLFLSLPGIGSESLSNITYSLFLDNEGYIWIGSKGHGLSVSTKPLGKSIESYKNLTFKRYEYSEKDTFTIGNNNIYSICQDQLNNLWIGTYGNGLSVIINPHGNDQKIIRINQQNSNISSDLVRNILIDSSGNLWVATTLGLNFLEKKNLESGNFRFRVFLHNTMDDKSLIYNDIIHIFEDSRGKLWFGTFGGGADVLDQFDEKKASFRHYGTEILPGHGIIFGILEDNNGKIWLSSENGLIRIDPVNETSEVYNNFNGLGFNNFSENTCFKRKDGSLIFGGILGIEVIRPEIIIPPKRDLRIELTKFLLFNREVSTYQKDSPLSKSISFSDRITLRYFQSSFSIDYTALDFLDPDKIEYSYKLDNFDRSWNNVGIQHRATYTNLSPGKYIFRVKSVQRNGRDSSEERVLNIIIKPPWWKTIPAYIIYAIILIGIIYSIYKTIARINRYKNELIIEKKVNEYKLKFFTNISHEIRTPLTLIIGPLEDMLAEGDISNKNRLQMEIMLKNARRMLHLTNQLLDFRKVQNNKMVLKIKKLDIVTFTSEILTSFKPLANHKGITCNFETQFESFHIYADPNKLDTIIYNIISNALKFTNTGKQVSISIREPENADYIDISVSDEGPGIPMKDLPDLFTRYTILSNDELAGTGIGLSLSYELAKLHKGNILVNSTEGKGSTFIIRLLKGNNHFLSESELTDDEIFETKQPFKHRNEIIGSIEKDDLQFPDSPDKNVILIVEDNHEISNYISQSLKSFYICIGARNGSEGLHLAKTMNPDLIITDIMMPEMDGIEMTRLLKEDFNTSHIPVIMLTSKSDLKDQIEGIETGAESYIVKPFSMDYLKTVAGTLINQRAKVIARYVEKNNSETKPLNISSKDDEFLNRIVAYIEENYSTDFPMDTLAEICNISRTVFYNKLKGLTGSSPIEFVRKIKLNIALKLLEKGFNVTEVAFKTGFNDVKYFSRIFKKQFGYSPSKHKT